MRQHPTTYDVDSTKLAIALLKKARELKRLTLLAVIAITLSSCAGSTGWRFEIGVSPVKTLNNQAGLTQEVENPAPQLRRQ